MAASQRLLAGVFPNRASAERAYRSVVACGYTQDDIDLLMSDATRYRHFEPADDTVFGRPGDTELGARAARLASTDVGVGGSLAAIAAAAAALAAGGAHQEPPRHDRAPVNPLAAALASAGTGSTGPGLIGALIEAGMAEDRVEHYRRAVREGGILMAMRLRDDEDAEFLAAHWQAAHGAAISR